MTIPPQPDEQPTPATAPPAERQPLTSEQVGRRAVAIVLAGTAVLAVGVMVGELTGRDEQAGTAPHSASPTQTAPPPPSPGDGTVGAGPDTTGVPEGTALVPHAPGTVQEDGLVLDGVLVLGDLELVGRGQVLRNSRVEGHVVTRGDDVTIEDSEVGALSVAGSAGAVARRVEVFGNLGDDGIHVTSDGAARTTDVLIEGCWVHSPQVEPDSHYDGIQVRGVDGLTLRGSTLDLGQWMDRHNAAVFLEDANGGNTDVLVERNVINGGGYSVYVAGQGVRFVDNRFGRDANWGLLYPEHPPFEESGSVWADDGAPVSLLDATG